MLPNWYAASSRLLPPESSGSNPLSSALSSNLSAAASALLGQGSGDFLRYRTILSSRSLYERVVEEFDLIRVYETDEALNPRDAAIRMLAENTSYPVDDEDEFLSVVAYDRDPQRAADMANFIVSELNRRNSELASQNAANYRKYVESRYDQAMSEMDSLKDAMQGFQEEFGVFDLEGQVENFLGQIADVRVNAIAMEIEYEALLSQYGPSNAAVITARNASRVANQKSSEMLEGQEQLLPVSKEDFPEVMRAYIELEQEILVQKSLIEIIAPMYEQARFQEEREFESVQVVDVAVPPSEKAKPKRSIIVIGATLSAFFLCILFVLALDLWKSHGRLVLQRITEEAERKP